MSRPDRASAPDPEGEPVAPEPADAGGARAAIAPWWLEEVRDSDFEALARLEAASFAQPAESAGPESAPQGHPWSAEALRRALEAPGAVALVARAGLDPAGYALFRRVLDEAELLRVAVDPAWRGRGIGRSLVLRGLERLRDQGCAAVFLEVHEANVAALALYRSTGWEDAGRRAGYYPGGGAAAILRRVP